MRCPLFKVVASISIISVIGIAQTKPSVKRGVRPVFVTASRLAASCQDWAAVLYPYGHPLRDEETVNVTQEQIAHAAGCEMYILGVADQKMEPGFGSHYRPLASKLAEIKALIDTFLKYVKDHPEQEDFAASTLLSEAEKIIVKTQKQ